MRRYFGDVIAFEVGGRIIRLSNASVIRSNSNCGGSRSKMRSKAKYGGDAQTLCIEIGRGSVE
jgi:hypothetical protein